MPAVEDFALALGRLRDEAGRPTFRQMARRAHCSAATLCRAVQGTRLPALEVTLAFVRACGGDQAEWAGRWRAAAAAEAAERSLTPPRADGSPGRGGARASPAAAWLASADTPRQLPYPTAGFAGRREELTALHELLPGEPGRAAPPREGSAVAPSQAMAVISGMAGAGKTALAVRFCHSVADRFPGGQLYLDLRGFDRAPELSPGEALGRILHGLGVGAAQVPPDVEDRVLMYRSVMAGRRMIVLLDNAASAEQVSPLLPGSPECLVVTTSRRTLTGLVSRYGARPIRLSALSPAESLQVLEAVIGRDPVATDLDATLELAWLCGHLPLALRLAAAILAVQPGRRIAELAAELARDRLSGLKADEGPAISAAFGLSYQRLDAPARHMFRMLSLVPGPDFTGAAAAAAAGVTEERANGLLGTLNSMHLAERHAAGRYRFHDLIRMFADQTSRAADPARDRDQALSRLLGHYLGRTDAASRRLYPHTLRLAGPAPTAGACITGERALEWLEEERQNVVAAVRACAGQRSHAASAYELVDALSMFLRVRGYTEDWLAVAGAGLTAALSANDLRAETAMRRTLADCLGMCGRYPAATTEFSHALDASRACGWRAAEAAILSGLAVVSAEERPAWQAIASYRQVLSIYRDIGDRHGEVRVMYQLGGDLLWKLGRLEPARHYLIKALAGARETGSRLAELSALINLGNVVHEQGDLEVALGYLTAAFDLSREVGLAIGEAISLCDMGGVHRDLGLFDRSVELGTSALNRAREIGDVRVEAECLNALADYHLRTGSPDAAADCARQALHLASAHGQRHTRARALNRLAAAALDDCDLDGAAVYCAAGLALARSAGYRMLEGIALTISARLALTRGEHDQGAELARRAVTMLRKTGHRPGEAIARNLLDEIPGYPGGASGVIQARVTSPHA